MSQAGVEGVRVTENVNAFFQDALSKTIARQRVAVQGETEIYLVNLLVTFLSPDALFSRDPDGQLGSEPLAFMLKRAVEAEPGERARHLKRMGDTALYTSGFFSDSLTKGLVDIDYYASMGGRAYDVLGGMRHGGVGTVFRELANKFRVLVDVLSEISERAAMTSNAGLLRLYERYAQTGSERLRVLLADRGVLAMPSTFTLN